ncbi:MAG: hypothetical protein H7Z42_14575 [Roseiflexaceae bacterium]|nr:hypothetical protein [Roseiflexaceae bacterium]
MAVTSKNLHANQRSAGLPTPLRERFQIGFYAITLLLAAVAIYAVVGLFVGGFGTLADDLRYGRPRTDHLTAYVQHGETPGHPTHLMAVNLNRQVSVIEIPGGDPAKARSISGPYLFGAKEDLTPVTLHLRDMDGDGRPDLLIDVRREQIVYLNRDDAFRLPTPEEQAGLALEAR